MSLREELIAKYGASVVPLERICGNELDLSFESAKLAAAKKKLPFPTFRARDSRKAPLMVDLADVAKSIEDRAQAARGAA
jgi:hypothetical protein